MGTRRRNRLRRKYYQYDSENLEEAISSSEEETFGKRQAARRYGGPYETLRDRPNKRYKSHGSSTVLSYEEEKKFCGWINHMCDRGFPMKKNQLLDSVQLYLNYQNRETVFVNNRPGRDWYEIFLKRHPKVFERTSKILSKSSADLTEDVIREWFTEVRLFCN